MEEKPPSREELENVASNIYGIDYVGIFLNGIIAAFGSGVGTLMLNLTVGLNASTTYIAFLATFLPLFTVKVVAEYAKQRAVAEGQIHAFIRGARRSDEVRMAATSSTWGLWLRVFYVCDAASFVRTSIFDYNTKFSWR